MYLLSYPEASLLVEHVLWPQAIVYFRHIE